MHMKKARKSLGRYQTLSGLVTVLDINHAGPHSKGTRNYPSGFSTFQVVLAKSIWNMDILYLGKSLV